jgi:chemotaxis protein methyltransferase CheR
MRQKTFNRLSDIVYAESGIALSPAKRALLMARTGKRIRALGLKGYEDYVKVLEADETGGELVEFLDAVSTNVTSFYREPEHFDIVQASLEDWIKHGQRRIRAWSAGCSSGEEPYTLAMTLLEAIGERDDVDARILATDINTHTLETARAGAYSDEKARAIPAPLRYRYMERIGTRQQPSWVVREDVRRLVVCRRLNLARPPFAIKGPLDLVFCRNTMIYFDQRVREDLLREFHRVLRRGGLLIVGHAESLAARSGLFVLQSPSVLVRN